MIPVSEPLIESDEIGCVIDCLQSGWISSLGGYVNLFEDRWSTYCGMKHGIAVGSGTAALQIAVRLLDMQAGDEVIMPAFTMISCALAVAACNGVPVLIDSDPRSWQMDTSQIEAKITSRTRAIMAVHIYGHPVDMDPVIQLASRHRLMVIEDAAESHGAQYKGRICGGMGDTATFSFYANKLITTGDGGMILTQDDDLAERARSLRALCSRKGSHFLHDDLGYNCRMSNIQAAIGAAQVQRIHRIVERKRAIAAAYSERLSSVAGIVLPSEEDWARSVYWVYGILLDEDTGYDSARFAECLAMRGVETRPFFIGMHEQPVFQKMGLFRGERYPVAERLSRQGLYLPSGLTIREQDIDQVCDAVRFCLSSRI